MQAEEVKTQLAMIEQLARGLNLALKHSAPEVRMALQRSTFTKNSRIILQRYSYLLVGSCHRAKAVAK